MSWFSKFAKWAAIAAALFLVVMLILGRRPGAGRDEYSIEIARPPAEVFPWLTEPDRLTRWLSGLESSTPLGGDSAVRGAKSREVILVNGRRYTLITEIVDIRHDTLIVVHIESDPKGFSVDARYDLSAIGTGTRLHYVGDAHYDDMFARIMEPIITPQSQKKVEANLKHLKSLVEAQPTGRGI